MPRRQRLAGLWLPAFPGELARRGCVAGEGGTGHGATSPAGSGFWGPPRSGGPVRPPSECHQVRAFSLFPARPERAPGREGIKTRLMCKSLSLQTRLCAGCTEGGGTRGRPQLPVPGASTAALLHPHLRLGTGRLWECVSSFSLFLLIGQGHHVSCLGLRAGSTRLCFSSCPIPHPLEIRILELGRSGNFGVGNGGSSRW